MKEILNKLEIDINDIKKLETSIIEQNYNFLSKQITPIQKQLKTNLTLISQKQNTIKEELYKNIYNSYEEINKEYMKFTKKYNEILSAFKNENNPLNQFKEKLINLLNNIISILSNIKKILLNSLKITFKTPSGTPISIELYINTKTLPQKNNTYRMEERNGTIHSNYISLLNGFKAYIENNKIENFKDGEINILGNSLFTFLKSQLHTTNGKNNTHLCFYITKTNEILRIYICDYINQQEHNSAFNSNKKLKYKKIMLDILNREYYEKNGQYERKIIVM